MRGLPGMWKDLVFVSHALSFRVRDSRMRNLLLILVPLWLSAECFFCLSCFGPLRQLPIAICYLLFLPQTPEACRQCSPGLQAWENKTKETTSEPRRGDTKESSYVLPVLLL